MVFTPTGTALRKWALLLGQVAFSPAAYHSAQRYYREAVLMQEKDEAACCAAFTRLLRDLAAVSQPQVQ